LERDVARGARANGEDRTRRRSGIAGTDEEKPVSCEWRRNIERRHSLELPQQLSVEIIGANPARAVRHDLGAYVVLPYERRGPVVGLVPIDPPQLAAALPVERHDEGLVRVVVDDIQPVLVEDRRGASSELVAAVERAELTCPYRLAAQVERGDETDGAEVDVDALAVCHRRFRRKTVLDVPRSRRQRASQLPLPANSS